MDYTKQCWSCGKVTMVSKGAYYQCSNCGTTWNEVPAPTNLPLAFDYLRVSEHDGAVGPKHPRPSHRVTASARKTREASKEGKQ